MLSARRTYEHCSSASPLRKRMWFAGWNLINEPRCTGCGTGPLQAWITEMAQHVKSLDPNHLLSIGAEGFYAHGGANPGGASSCALLLQNAMCEAV